VEAKCIAGKVKLQETGLTLPHKTFAVFTYIGHISIANRKCVGSYGLVQHCNGVTEFKQVETRCPITYLGNAFSVDVINHGWEQKFVYCLVDTLFPL